MAKTCELCAKKPMVGHHRKLLRGHYNVTGKRRFRPNLQPAKIEGKSILACVKCIRNLNRAGRNA